MTVRAYVVENIVRRLLLGGEQHEYLSTYCLHADHRHCKLACKVCESPCLCWCHRVDRGERGPL